MKSITNKVHRNNYYPLELTRIEIRVIVGINPEWEKPLTYGIDISDIKPHKYGKNMEIKIDPLKIPWKELKTMRVKKNG
uniref:Uncharacterized protein n=1 Tax=viral metagenome TaxID=1070528 RepID=A0A6M3KDN0_9ZZZZ